MKSFEQWWIKYYKYCVIAGLVFLLFQTLKNGFAGYDVKGAIVFFAIITLPIVALIGQGLVWIFKLLKLFLDIFAEYLKLRKEKKG